MRTNKYIRAEKISTEKIVKNRKKPASAYAAGYGQDGGICMDAGKRIHTHMNMDMCK